MKKRTKKEQRIVAVLKAIRAAEILTQDCEKETELYYLVLIRELQELLAHLKKS